jgi:hypothetical protein
MPKVVMELYDPLLRFYPLTQTYASESRCTEMALGYLLPRSLLIPNAYYNKTILIKLAHLERNSG